MTQARRRTLIVDDEPAIRDILRVILQRDGWMVDCVADGEEAVRELNEHQYDVVVLDLLMPRMDGAAVLQHMSATGNRTPVVVVSGAEQQEPLDSAIVRVALRKPFEIGDLRAILRAIVDSAT